MTSDGGLRYSESRVADVPPLTIEIDLKPTRRESVRHLVLYRKTKFSIGLSCVESQYVSAMVITVTDLAMSHHGSYWR